MDATTFYSEFESAFSEAQGRIKLSRLAGKSSKWKYRSGDQSLVFSFATNLKTAGLLPNLPAEFRLRLTWDRREEGRKIAEIISPFQYTTEVENHQFATLQRIALEKFLAQPTCSDMRHIFNYASDPSWSPRANIEEWSYYTDAEDARAWGSWYATLLPAWIPRFLAAPESNRDWAWRVLWPHLERTT